MKYSAVFLILGITIGALLMRDIKKMEIEVTNIGGYEETITIPIPTQDYIPLNLSPPILGKYEISSDFGYRVSPFTKEHAIHYGTDFVGSKNCFILAVADGVVINHWIPPNGRYKGHPIYGGYIEILHNGFVSRYAHLSQSYIKEGQDVVKGQIIGRQGSTGLATGEHLHFELLFGDIWNK